MNAHLVLPVLEAELPQGTSPPRAPRPTGAFPAADSGHAVPGVLSPIAYPTADPADAHPQPADGTVVPAGGPNSDPGATDGAAGTAWGRFDTGETSGEATHGDPHAARQPSGSAHAATASTSAAADPMHGAVPAAADPAYGAVPTAADPMHGAIPNAADPAYGAVHTAANLAYGATADPAAGAVPAAGDPAYGGGPAVSGIAYGAGSTATGLTRGADSAVGAAAGTAYGVASAVGIGRGAFAGAQLAGTAVSAGRVELGRSAAVGAPRLTGPSRPKSGGAGRATRWLGVPQIVCWQLAMIVAGLGLRESMAIKIVAGVTALLLLTGVSVRWGGQWLYQWIAHAVRFCLRRRSLRAARIGQEAQPVVLALLAKDTWTRAVQLDADAAAPAEATTDAVADAGGLSAALWLPAEGARIDALPSARELLDVMEKQPVTMVAQTVQHTGTRPDEPARTWIALRAWRSADLADDADLEAVLANGLRRVARRLDRLRIEAEPLTGRVFPDTLAALAHVSGGRDVLTESWAACRTGPVIQVTYRLAGFDQLPQAAAGMFLEHVLHRPERVATTVAVTAWRDPGAATRAATVLRIAAVNRSALDQAARGIARLAAEFGVRPERLDGRHRAGVLASLPLGHTTPGGYHS